MMTIDLKNWMLLLGLTCLGSLFAVHYIACTDLEEYNDGGGLQNSASNAFFFSLQASFGQTNWEASQVHFCENFKIFKCSLAFS